MKERKLSEYQVLEYFVTHVDLEIDLSKQPVQAKSSLTINPNKNSTSHSINLTLDGENMILETIVLDGKVLNPDQYELTKDSLTIKNIPQDRPFNLTTTTLLGENKDLFGLYESEGVILVKAETEGMRRVHFCNDRPDNLATYKTTIKADQKKYSVLLSNGKIIARAELPNGLHSVTWLDEIPKPSYLFALVAGNLEYSSVLYKSQSKQEIPIEFFVPAKDTHKCIFAKQVLPQVMAWDEKTNDLLCKLPQHMVTGVPKYASGASEPTGLNIFNSKNLYATPASRTDVDFLNVLKVLAHEYLHLWSGDLVTIRDWFNLTVKEGLTDFRTDMFRESLFGTDIVRLMDGKNLDERAPRQSSYTAVRSLYTPAAYEKSAHIFRMLMLVVGKEAFIPALTKYFKDNEGKAVTLEILLNSISTTTGVNLTPYLPWFDETGIPELKVRDNYNPKTHEYTLTIETIDGKARPVPCVIGLMGSDGKELVGDTTLIIDQPKMEFKFNSIFISSRPVPSLLRSFSAPVRVNYDYSNDDLLLLIRSDTNIYNRCEAAKNIITKMIIEYCSSNKSIDETLTPAFFETFRSLFKDKSVNDWLLAEFLTLPSLEDLIATLPKPDFEKIESVHKQIKLAFATELKVVLHERFNRLERQGPTPNPLFSTFNFRDSGVRRLKALCYSYFQLTDSKKVEEDLYDRFNDSLSKNMTDTISSLTTLIEMDSTKVESLLTEFYEKWHHDPDAINYWFTMQASTHDKNIVVLVECLMRTDAFDIANPNNVYALLIPFINNPYGFHDITGRGYKLVAEVILQLDKVNAPVAAKLTERFNNWDHYDATRQKMMFENLALIDRQAVSEDVKNAAKKGLDKAVKEPLIPLRITLLAPPSKVGHKTEETPELNSCAVMQHD